MPLTQPKEMYRRTQFENVYGQACEQETVLKAFASAEISQVTDTIALGTYQMYSMAVAFFGRNLTVKYDVSQKSLSAMDNF